MTSKLKILGPAILALLAVGAATAPAASAHEFRSEVKPTILTGDGTASEPFVFTVPGLALECDQSHFHGTMSESPAKEITIVPTYKECHSSALDPVTINMNGCAEILTGNTVNEDAPIHIECPKNERIEISIEAINCTLRIAAQTPEGGMHFTNQGKDESRDIEATATVEGILYEKVGGFLCGLVGTGEDAGYTGAATLKGYDDKEGVQGEQVGVWVS